MNRETWPWGCKELDTTEYAHTYARRFKNLKEISLYSLQTHLAVYVKHYYSLRINSACNVGDMSSIPGLGRSPAEGKSYPLWYSGLENSMDSIVHGAAKSWTRLSDIHFHFHRVVVFHFSYKNTVNFG